MRMIMKKRTFAKYSMTALVLLLVITTAVLPVFAAVSVPRHENYIADDAKLLSEGTIRNITRNNEALWEKNGHAIGVCTVKTIGDEPIAKFAARVYESWGMVEGVLIVVVAESTGKPELNNFYLIQSTGVETSITNADLETLRNDYMEADFAAGNIDRAVFGTATKLTAMLSELKDPDASAEPEASEQPVKDAEKSEETTREGTTAGGVIVGILKFLLIAALILIALFVLWFIAAMFNDDAAELMQKYVFKRGKTNSNPSDFYDERLYGTNHQIQQRGRQNAQRSAQQYRQQAPNSNAYQQSQQRAQAAIPPARQQYNPQYNQQQYRQNPNAQRQNGYAQQNYTQQTRNVPNNGYVQQRPVMYNADGTVRRTRPAQQSQQVRQNPQNAPRQNNYRQQPVRQNVDNGATQMFSLHDSNNY